MIFFKENLAVIITFIFSVFGERFRPEPNLKLVLSDLVQLTSPMAIYKASSIDTKAATIVLPLNLHLKMKLFYFTTFHVGRSLQNRTLHVLLIQSLINDADWTVELKPASLSLSGTIQQFELDHRFSDLLTVIFGNCPNEISQLQSVFVLLRKSTKQKNIRFKNRTKSYSESIDATFKIFDFLFVERSSWNESDSEIFNRFTKSCNAESRFTSLLIFSIFSIVGLTVGAIIQAHIFWSGFVNKSFLEEK